MRRCRKLISMIVMMAMLATMTPYQALAADTPTESAAQEILPGEEVQEQGESETIPEESKTSEEVPKDTEENKEAAPAGGTEAPAEVTPATNAEDNNSANTGENPEQAEKPEESEGLAGDTSLSLLSRTSRPSEPSPTTPETAPMECCGQCFCCWQAEPLWELYGTDAGRKSELRGICFKKS